jgi:uncharacterized repeat protein (TIGR01451 family)
MSPLPRFPPLLRCNYQLQPYQLLLSALLLAGQGWLWLRPAIGQVVPDLSPPPGTIIENQSTGSYLDDSDLTDKAIESDLVKLTVAEVAGITVTAGGITGSTITGAIAYFDFVLTNVGNDPTQFFIPDAPSAIAGGTKSGDIKIISYDPDGNGATAAVVLDSIVPAGGATTGTILSSMTTANKGSIPAGATVTIRVPVSISATSGNVTVTMGNTPADGQNQPVVATPGLTDLRTVDNPGTSSGDTSGPPLNGEREASLTQSLAVSITTNTANAPTVTCTSDRRIFSTAYNGNGGFSTTGRDTYWDSVMGTASGPPPTTGWIDAFATGNQAPGAWTDSIYGDAGWISHFVDTDHTAFGDVDIYFRYQFNLDPTVDSNSYQLMMDFFGDNSIADIFVNGVSQKAFYPSVLPQNPSDPYYYGGYNGAGRAALTLTHNWQTGPNEIIVQVKSGPGLVGLIAQSNPSYLCKSDLGDALISYGTAPHAIVTNPKAYIGSVPPDADNYRDATTPVTTPAYSDNTAGGDEDTFTTPLKSPISGTYNLSVPVHNTSGAAVTLYAWIDFNNDGKFGVGESQSISVANNATTASLSWVVPSGTTSGSTYARFRLTKDSLIDNPTTTDVDERSIIDANDGEVEDYPIDLVLAGNPNLLLVKRITAINGATTISGGGNLAMYEDQSSNPYDDNAIDTPAVIPPDTDKWPIANGFPFMIGAVDGGNVKPQDSIEYTIYFLSAGTSTAKNVLFCDRVPANVTFSLHAFTNTTANPTGVARGIAISSGDTLNYYTNAGDSDLARYFPPGIEPSTVYPNINCGKNATGQVLPNDNGAVVVNLGDRPNATGVPADDRTNGAYGFVRFQGVVK